MTADAPSFERRVLTSLAAALPAAPRPDLCVALSGGLDSTVLLTVLARAAVIRRRLRVDQAWNLPSSLSTQTRRPKTVAICQG